MSILSSNDLTALAHVTIFIGVIASYIKAKRVEDLLDIQKRTIETMQDNQLALEKGFEACKQNLAKLEKLIKK